jgi:hypothetical protein
MRITEAAQILGTSPRMLRYRDLLGLLPPVRERTSRARARAGRRASPGTPEGSGAPQGTGYPAETGRPERAAQGEGTGRPGRSGRPAGHRRFSDDDLAAVAFALRLEQRYDISPAALAFGLRVLTEPGVRADVAELGRRISRIGPPPARALDFEQQRALRLLSLTQPPVRRESSAPQGRPPEGQPRTGQPPEGRPRTDQPPVGRPPSGRSQEPRP